MKKTSNFEIEFKKKISIKRYPSGRKWCVSRKENPNGEQRVNPENHAFHALAQRLAKNEVRQDATGMAIDPYEYKTKVADIGKRILRHIADSKAKGGDLKPLFTASTLSQTLYDLKMISFEYYNAVRMISKDYATYTTIMQSPRIAIETERRNIGGAFFMATPEDAQIKAEKLMAKISALRDLTIAPNDGRKPHTPAKIMDSILSDDPLHFMQLDTGKDKWAYGEVVSRVAEFALSYRKR